MYIYVYIYIQTTGAKLSKTSFNKNKSILKASGVLFRKPTGLIIEI